MDAIRLPALGLGVTMCIYWGCVLVMMIKVSRKNRGLNRVLIPQQRKERVMWLLWGPLVLAWMVLPLVAASRPPGGGLWTLPAWVGDGAFVLAVRFAAAALAVVCLGLSVICWRHMGRDWRMAVDPRQEGRLIDDGPFRRVRHPIYALSIVLMICSVVAVPTIPMIAVGVVHVALMWIKAGNEEHHLMTRFGADYGAYCRRTGRFVPRLRSLG